MQLIAGILLGVFAAVVALAAAAAGSLAAASAAAGACAVLLPELMYQAQLAKLRRVCKDSGAFLAIRYKLVRLASTIVFLAVSLQVLGAQIHAPAWILAVAAQALLTPAALLALAQAKRR